jgi:hypothetical protein
MAFCHSQVGVPKLPKFGLSWLWSPITLCVDLRLRWGLKQSCSPRWELFNGMSHATCTQGNRGDSWLLVVGSQIANLTPGLSFGHNLCFRCLNGWCKPILDIYDSIDFQWYKKFLEPLGFGLCNRSLNIKSLPGFQLPTWEFTWECEGSFSHTLLHSRGHENATPGLVLARTLAIPLPWSRAQG